MKDQFPSRLSDSLVDHRKGFFSITKTLLHSIEPEVNLWKSVTQVAIHFRDAVRNLAVAINYFMVSSLAVFITALFLPLALVLAVIARLSTNLCCSFT